VFVYVPLGCLVFFSSNWNRKNSTKIKIVIGSSEAQFFPFLVRLNCVPEMEKFSILLRFKKKERKVWRLLKGNSSRLKFHSLWNGSDSFQRPFFLLNSSEIPYPYIPPKNCSLCVPSRVFFAVLVCACLIFYAICGGPWCSGVSVICIDVISKGYRNAEVWIVFHQFLVTIYIYSTAISLQISFASYTFTFQR